MSSLLVIYDGDKVETRNILGRIRGLAWDWRGSSLMVVGNGGTVLKIQDRRLEVTLDTGLRKNLRSVSINPSDNRALVVGNSGTIITIEPDGSVAKLNSPVSENLRVVRWKADGSIALIAGNNGALIKYIEGELEMVNDGRANLRGISWRNGNDEALVTSNCFAEEFIPSPNLFLFDARVNTIKPVSDTHSDFIGVDWNPNENFALVVGYDVIWHNGVIARFDDSGLSPVELQDHHVYPTAVSWDPKGRVAAIASSTPQPHSSQGRILLWDRQTFREIYRNEDFFFSSIAWSPVGFKLAAVASTEARTFDN